MGTHRKTFTMALMKKSGRFHLPVISAVGGAMHNTGQLLVACVIVSTYGIVYYIPFLLIMVIGSVAVLVLPAARKGMNGGNRG